MEDPIVGWINIYSLRDDDLYVVSPLRPSKVEADKHAHSDRLDCVPVRSAKIAAMRAARAKNPINRRGNK